MNNLYPSINFTIEIGGNGINSLNLKISLLRDRFDLRIYRKVIITDALIRGLSYSHLPLPPHKKTALNSFIHRLVSFRLSLQAHAHEASILKHLAAVNSIKNNIHVDGLIQKK